MKAVALFSGGLDSILAIKIIEKQGIDIIPVVFKSYFFDSERAERFSNIYQLNLKVIDFSNDHLKIVMKPIYGYGKNLNPCIDCHALMIKMAGEIMTQEKASFLITGEVLGERPFSQSKRGLDLIDKLSGLGDITLRPLSAKVLKPTLPERNGWVDRKKLYGLQGRSRKAQFELAVEYGIKIYDSPAGGCLLTDPNFAKKMKNLLKTKFESDDISLLGIGRHFFIDGYHFIVGRNEMENKKLLGINGIHIYAIDKKGPVGLLKYQPGEKTVKKMCKILARYCSPYGETRVKVHKMGEFQVLPYSREDVEKLLR